MTSSLTLLVVAVSFWLLVYIRRRYIRSSTNRSLLPVTTHSQQDSRVLWTIGRYAEVDIASTFIIRGRSTLFVDSHAKLLDTLGGSTSESTSFPRRTPTKPARCCLNWGYFVRAFYNLGSVTAIVGQALAVGALWWSLLQIGLRLLGNSNTQPSTIIAHSMVKRNSAPMMPPINQPSQFRLRPLIPGVNLPLSHLLPIFVSLMVCTTIHELGHAMAAAADGVPLISWGYYIIIVIPAAFVELATALPTSRDLPPLLRLRITSAGVYHNLMTILVLLFSTNSIGRALWPLFGYQVIDTGVVVVDVHVSSPLRPHLLPGSIIIRIDDVGLWKTSNYTPHELWSSRLLIDTVEYEEGWCMERDWFDDHSQSCCVPFPLQHENEACFITHPSRSTTLKDGRCIDPVPLFQDQTKQRCSSHITCNVFLGQDNVKKTTGTVVVEKEQVQICVKPHSEAGLLRITFLKDADDFKENTIVWKGPRKEVWEQVIVGEYRPRLRILPVSLPTDIALVVRYLQTVSLCLFFFNLLPIRSLDGGKILNAFLEYVLSVDIPGSSQRMPLRRGDVDLEMGGREWNSPLAWRRTGQRLEAVAEAMTVTLLGVVFVGEILELGVG